MCDLIPYVYDQVGETRCSLSLTMEVRKLKFYGKIMFNVHFMAEPADEVTAPPYLKSTHDFRHV